jgi:cysteine-rich repeat protein
VELKEACDDGNQVSGDGCSADCLSTEVCGNGIVDTAKGEVCDSHAGVAGNYCSADCQTSTKCALNAGQTLEQKCDDQNECTSASCDVQNGCGEVLSVDAVSCASGAGSCRSGGCVVPMLSGGYGMDCALDKFGQLTCWGDVSSIGTKPSGVLTKISANYYGSCGLKAPDGDVTCWGTYSSYTSYWPRTQAKEVSAGYQFACIVRKDTHALQCWGTTSYNLNVPPSGAFTKVAQADYNACAIRETDGTIACWGYTGNGGTASPSGAFTQIAAIESRFCALRSDGIINCWGDNSYGNAPAQASSEHFVGVTVGRRHSCGLRANGTAFCWGEGEPEEHDSSYDFGQSTPPTNAADVFSQVIAGTDVTCGLRTGGGVSCWGNTALSEAKPPGTCGNGTVELKEACDDGNQVSGDGCSADCLSTEVCGNGIVDTAKGEVCDSHAGVAGNYCSADCQASTKCALNAGQTLEQKCDDQNECTSASCDVQNGCGEVLSADALSCASGAGSCRSGGCVVPMLSGAYGADCALDKFGQLTCWGDLSHISAKPSGVLTKISANYYGACALKAPDGDVTCWGNYNSFSSTWPRTQAKEVSAGYQLACIVRKDTHALQCWGTTSYNLNVPPSGAFTKVATADSAACAIRETDGTIACWGYTGNGATASPNGSFTQIAAGANHFCALRTDGAVNCWGDNTNGKAPASPTTEKFVAVSAGYDSSCALRADGSVMCWGNNASGQAVPPTTAADVFTQISVGQQNACGVRRGGGIACWGNNTSNQSTPPGTCGNGILEPKEACDDSNLVAGDGCSATCTSTEVCGNGIIDASKGEVCDDGNGANRSSATSSVCNGQCNSLWSTLTSVPAPSAYFDFDEPLLGGDYPNLGIGPNASGVVIGGASVGVPGLIKQAPRFTGVADASSIVDYIALHGTPSQGTSLTLSAWIRPNAVAPALNRSEVVSFTDTTSAQAGWSLDARSSTSGQGQLSFKVGNPGLTGTPTQSSASVNWNGWTHVVARYDEASHLLDLHVNGVLVDQIAASGFTQIGYTAQSLLRIGYGFNGAVDEVAAWTTPLSDADIANLYLFGSSSRSIRQQVASNQYLSPCARELARNPFATDGIYDFQLTDDLNPRPVYCDMNGGGWTMLLKKSTGVVKAADVLWLGGEFNDRVTALLGRAKATQDYSSGYLNWWSMFRQAKVEVVTGTTINKSLLFNSYESTISNWFHPARYLSGSWTDVPTDPAWQDGNSQSSGHYFTISNGGRSFYINNNYGGCSSDQGWLMMTTSGGSCSFDSGYAVRYSTLTTKQVTQSFGTADALVIWAR